MDLPIDIIYEIFRAIPDYSDCLSFAMTCKYIWALWQSLGPKIEIIKHNNRIYLEYRLKAVSLGISSFKMIASDGKIDWQSDYEECKLVFKSSNDNEITATLGYSYIIYSGKCITYFHRCTCDAEKTCYHYYFYLSDKNEDFQHHRYCKDNYKNCELCCQIPPEYIQNNLGPLLNFSGRQKLKITLNYLVGTRFVCPEL